MSRSILSKTSGFSIDKVLPKASRKVAIKLEAFIFVALIVLEYILLPPTEAPAQDVLTPQLNTNPWVEENRRINENSAAELIDDGNWVWRTEVYPVAVAKPTRWRILVMGDSFVWGDGYSNFNDTWWRQLQRELFSRGYRAEVIAAGKRGASTWDQFKRVDEIISKYKPDMIIWGYVVNDPDEGIISPPLGSDALSKDAAYNIHKRMIAWNVLPRLNFQLMSLREQKLAQGLTYGEWELALLSGKNIEKYATTLNAVSEWSRESGIPYFFLSLPHVPEAVSMEERIDQAANLFEEARIPFYNIVDEFIDFYPSEPGLASNILKWGINPTNGHPGPVSTRFYARQAVDILERDFAWILSEEADSNLKPIEINQWRPWNLDIKSHSRNRIEFFYPDDDQWMLRMPYGKPYAQFNFAFPVAINEIQLSGPDLDSGTLYYSGEDANQQFESHRVIDAGRKSGNALTWSLEEYPFKDMVNTIRVSAEFEGNDRSLVIDLRPSEGGQ